MALSIDLSGLYGLMVIAGPIVLVIAIVWAMRYNRTSRHDLDRTEDATRRLYDSESRDDTAEERR